MFIHSAQKVKKYNLVYLTLDNTQILENLLLTFNNSTNSLKKINITDVFSSDGKAVEI